eukprot:GHVT01066062.1.p1 GENE.GHVT01066062.1~~GHVT01066062.1.p1  ORF type:complete len:210 (+),score=35.91 GHVT01066062.1:633-1262(+)
MAKGFLICASPIKDFTAAVAAVTVSATAAAAVTVTATAAAAAAPIAVTVTATAVTVTVTDTAAAAAAVAVTAVNCCCYCSFPILTCVHTPGVRAPLGGETLRACDYCMPAPHKSFQQRRHTCDLVDGRVGDNSKGKYLKKIVIKPSASVSANLSSASGQKVHASSPAGSLARSRRSNCGSPAQSLSNQQWNVLTGPSAFQFLLWGRRLR